jgi:uncharacterized membrane protein YedE/YeeE
VIVSLLGLANKRFGVLGGVTDLVQGSAEGRGLRSWRVMLLVGIVFGGLAYAMLAGAPDAGGAYSWLDVYLSLGGEVAVLFGAGMLIGVGARTAGGCTSGHGLTGSALASPASLVSMTTIMATAIATTVLAFAVAAGVLVGVRVQPRLAQAAEQAGRAGDSAPRDDGSRRPVNRPRSRDDR